MIRLGETSGTGKRAAHSARLAFGRGPAKSKGPHLQRQQRRPKESKAKVPSTFERTGTVDSRIFKFGQGCSARGTPGRNFITDLFH
jgi:hypothetical protein